MTMANSLHEDIPLTEVRAFIANLAKRHGVTYVKTGYDALADVITRLSDDEVKPDETENLVVALRRAKVIDGSTMVTLLGRYFYETRGVCEQPDVTQFAKASGRRPRP